MIEGYHWDPLDLTFDQNGDPDLAEVSFVYDLPLEATIDVP